MSQSQSDDITVRGLVKEHRSNLEEFYRDFIELLNKSPLPLFADATVSAKDKLKELAHFLMEQAFPDDSIENDVDSSEDEASYAPDESEESEEEDDGSESDECEGEYEEDE